MNTAFDKRMFPNKVIDLFIQSFHRFKPPNAIISYINIFVDFTYIIKFLRKNDK